MTDAEFALIVGRTKKIVLSAVRKHLAARFSSAIDDVVQETYLRGYRHLASGKFREESSLGSWLYTIARNESLRMNGKLSREEEKAEKAARQQLDCIPGTRCREDEFPDLGLLMEKLPLKYRGVMELKASGTPEKEIARRLGIGTGTVKSRFSRGKELLQKLSKEAG
jgi:RNA polymerase sigma-70 factor (ECF subfamily)